MPICSVAINAHLQRRNLKLASTSVGKSTGSAPSMSSSPLREKTDGMDGWMKGCLDTLVVSTSLQPFLCYRELWPATLQRSSTLCF